MWLPAGINCVAYAPLPRTSPVGLVSMHSAGLMAGPELGTPSCAYSRPLQQQLKASAEVVAEFRAYHSPHDQEHPVFLA